MATCEVCGAEIAAERLEVLPGTTTCAQHSQTSKRVCFMIATAAKGTASTLVIVPDNPEALRQARRAHLRRR